MVEGRVVYLYALVSREVDRLGETGVGGSWEHQNDWVRFLYIRQGKKGSMSSGFFLARGKKSGVKKSGPRRKKADRDRP